MGFSLSDMVLGKVECPEKRDELLKELNKRFSSEERACSVASDKGDGVGLLASGHQRTFLEVFVVVFLKTFPTIPSIKD